MNWWAIGAERCDSCFGSVFFSFLRIRIFIGFFSVWFDFFRASCAGNGWVVLRTSTILLRKHLLYNYYVTMMWISQFIDSQDNWSQMHRMRFFLLLFFRWVCQCFFERFFAWCLFGRMVSWSLSEHMALRVNDDRVGGHLKEGNSELRLVIEIGKYFGIDLRFLTTPPVEGSPDCVLKCTDDQSSATVNAARLYKLFQIENPELEFIPIAVTSRSHIGFPWEIQRPRALKRHHLHRNQRSKSHGMQSERGRSKRNRIWIKWSFS